ncbi:MAG TPA: hypothetical protein VNK70_00095 [Candidatus Paceibacterota bacterium]|nr:hypothetical protein [Candidatus Paceibacterota bacterium]
MTKETKTCQNCKQNFVIEEEDFDFYRKIDVPPPTWCPECRMIRRFMFRNERAWYKSTCSATGKKVLSMMAPDKGYTIYETNYYRSDAWDPLKYGRDYDFSRPFFAQFQELFREIPHPNLIQKNNVNSDYSNHTLNLKNCYYCASCDAVEDSAYLFTFMIKIQNSVDGHICSEIERCYEVVDCYKSSNLRFCQSCEGCADSWLLYDCRNCVNCIGCVGLRSKQYCIFNKQYTKEEYQKEMGKLNLNSYLRLQSVRAEFEELKKRVPRKFADIIKSENAIGDDIRNSRNVRGFTIRQDAENVRYGYRVSASRDIWDGFVAWNGAELEYEVMSCQAQRTICSALIWGGFDIKYSYNCFDCNNIFGCVGLRNKSYCILNKQYSKEGYEQLIPKIIEQMKTIPYRDTRGIEYGYGEFFPTEIAPFSYNETIAQDYFPKTKEEAAKLGYSWHEDAMRDYQVNMRNEELPDSIKDVEDEILDKVVACAHAGSNCKELCAGAFKMIPFELQFYRQMGVPLPRLCPSCRHFQRVKQKPPLKLYHRQCMCDYRVYKNTVKHNHHSQGRCPNEFETSYAPDRPEIVYCDQCYNTEIV